jgi:hypothetical protein
MIAVMAVVAAVLLLSVAPTTTAEAGIDSLQVESGTINPSGTTNVNIIADDDAGDVTIIITAGKITRATCYEVNDVGVSTGDACEEEDQPAVVAEDGTVTTPRSFTDITYEDDPQNITIGDVGGDGGSGTDLIIIGIQCPATGPVTIAITAIQGTSAKTGSINCRGAADTMESTVRDVTTTGDPKGNVIANIRADGADLGQRAAYVSARAKDSNGNEVASGTVLFTTSDGALKSAADTDAAANTAAIKSGWATIALVSDSSTGAGDDETVTASTAGRSVDAAVHFSGDPTTCTITADPANPAAGSTVDLAVLLLDSSEGPAADNIGLNKLVNGNVTGPTINAVNAQGAGTFAIFGEQVTGNGEAGDGIASAKLAVGLSGGTGIFVAVDAANCSERVAVSETVAVPAVPVTPAPAAGVAGFTGAAPAANSIGLLVTSGASTAPELVSALADAGCVVESLAILTGGVWSVYISGAPDVVNAAFPASLAASTPFFVRC